MLTEPPPSPRPNAKGGRPRKRGRLRCKPDQLVRDRRTPWQSTEATHYGRNTTVQFKTLCAQWYRATGTRLLRIVIVAIDSGTLPDQVLFSFDASLVVRTIIETYASRWSIEVFSREGRQLLGFADSQARTEAAVLRVAPLVGLLCSTLVIWFVQDIYRMPIAALPVRPWDRHKVGLCFADILRTAQRTITHADVLDPRSDINNLQQPVTPSRQRDTRRLDTAA